MVMPSNLGIFASIATICLCRAESNATAQLNSNATEGRWLFPQAQPAHTEIWWSSDDLPKTEDGQKMYYALGPNKLNYHAARQYCWDKQATLWCPRSEYENNMVFDNLQNHYEFPDNGQTWTGIKREQHTNKDDLNSWKCDCGSPDNNQNCPTDRGSGSPHVNYAKWNGGEPNNWGNELCISQLSRGSKWYDVSCDSHQSRPLCMTINPADHIEKRELLTQAAREAAEQAAAAAAAYNEWWSSDDLERTDNGQKMYFAIGPDNMKYSEAKDYCASREATLWCPRSEHENNMVYFNIQGDNDWKDNTWLGIKRDGHTNKDDMNSWKCDCKSQQQNNNPWANWGQPANPKCPADRGNGDPNIDYMQWQMGEPNNMGNELCISQMGMSERWLDVSCDNHQARPMCMTVNPAAHLPKRELDPEKKGPLEDAAAAVAAAAGVAAMIAFFFATCFGFGFFCYCCYGCFCCGCCCGNCYGMPCRKKDQATNNAANAEAQRPITPAPVAVAQPPIQPVYAAPVAAPMYTPAPMMAAPMQAAAPMNIVVNTANVNTNTNNK